MMNDDAVCVGCDSDQIPFIHSRCSSPRRIESNARTMAPIFLILVALLQLNCSIVEAFASHRRIGQRFSQYAQFQPLQTTAEDFAELQDPFHYNSDPNDSRRYSARDWFQNMKSLPKSSILRAIKGPVVAVMIWSGILSAFHAYLRTKGRASSLCMTTKPHSFLISALGLLLVFRTNSAYQRFAEGRRIWEQILSTSRTISRTCAIYRNEMGEDRQERISRLLAAFPYLLHDHIRPTELPSNLDIPAEYVLTLRRSATPPPRRKSRRPKVAASSKVIISPQPNLQTVDSRLLPWSLFPPKVLRRCAQSPNRPLWICNQLAQDFVQIPYSDSYDSRERAYLLGLVDRLTNAIGACERIHTTAIPMNYARHSLRALTLWLWTLPFGLLEGFGMLTGPVMGLAAWLMYGIYQIGFTIEDPFQGSLRLTILSEAILRDVLQGTAFMDRRMTAFEPDGDLISPPSY